MKRRATCLGLLLGGLLCIRPGPSPAQSSPVSPSTSSPFYIGADLGQAALRRDVGAIQPPAGRERHDLGWKLRFGYQFNRHVALEASYSDLGTYSAFAPFAIPAGVNAPLTGEFATSATGFGVSLLGLWPVGERFHLTANAGLIRREFESRWRQPDPYFPQPRQTDGDLAAQLGAGFGFALRKNLDLDFSWVTTRNVDGDIEFGTNVAEPSMTSLGVRFRL